jgi:hypothetical protein
VLDVVKHPLERFTFDRWGDFNIIASTTKLTVAVGRCGFRFLICSLQKDFEEFRRCRVVVLSVAKKLAQILLKKPVEVADPVQTLALDDHAEPWIGQEGTAGRRSFRIAAVDRDDGFKIAERLSLQAIKALVDEISALIDWQSHSDARCRHCKSPQGYSSQ